MLLSIEIDKVFDRFDDVDGDGMYSVGDRLLYIITVNNDGYQDLIAIAPDDALTDQGGRALALTALTPQVQFSLLQLMEIYLMLELETELLLVR